MGEKIMQVIGRWPNSTTMRNVYTHVQQTNLLRATTNERHVSDEQFAGLIANVKRPQALENQGLVSSHNSQNFHATC